MRTHPSNRDLLLPYCLPFWLYAGIRSVPGDWLGCEESYALCILACGGGTGLGLAAVRPARRTPGSPRLGGTGRGYLLRPAVLWDRARRQGHHHPLSLALEQRSVADVEPAGWTPLAVVISVAAFALGHTPPERLPAVAYGLLMTGLWIMRGDLLSCCVVAHAVTNIALAFYVRSTGQWVLW